MVGPLLVALASCGGEESAPESVSPAAVEYVGSARCTECHAEEAEAWRGSHHDLAMQSATDSTVLGDFDDVRVEHDGTSTLFFRRGAEFFANTQGASGDRADFRVSHVFGVEPLQQVLVGLPGGRLQCLPLAWDVEAERWYDLDPEVSHPPGSALHWTGVYQNWNTMCADCHSTNLVKGYDPDTDSYSTTHSELDVGCEACHGAGARHVEWASAWDSAADGEVLGDAGFEHPLRRGDGLAQVEACSPCHSLRTPVARNPQPGESLLDGFLPERLHAGAYFSDGQIQGEVYVYGSFAQSKMHARGVTCTDCHDPHSLELHRPGDAVCLQCHAPTAPTERFPTLTPKRYDDPAHHFHEPDSAGASCVACHMRARTYMGIDARRDHSFRVPRPDWTRDYGTPNACGDCHDDQGPEWALAELKQRGVSFDDAPGFTRAFHAARRGLESAVPELEEIARDNGIPPIVRATALDLLARGGPDTGAIAVDALGDLDARVRLSAVNALGGLEAKSRLDALFGALSDPIRSVRIEAVSALLGERATPQAPEHMALLQSALEEYESVQWLSSDRPSGRMNLAVLRERQGRGPEAVEHYRRALELDAEYAPARFNLATLYNRLGRNAEAIRVLEIGTELHPDEGELFYSLGLALAEEGETARAANALVRAAGLLPERPRVCFNAALALRDAGRLTDAVGMLIRARELNPLDSEAAHALALVYLAMEEWTLARDVARQVQASSTGVVWVDSVLEAVEASSD